MMVGTQREVVAHFVGQEAGTGDQVQPSKMHFLICFLQGALSSLTDSPQTPDSAQPAGDQYSKNKPTGFVLS